MSKRKWWLVIGAAVAAGLAWLMLRKPSAAGNVAANEGGHSTPEEAISFGWMVYPAGIGGWLETSPDGSQQITHSSGWTGDPFTR